jgi:hypothetical protein
MMAKLTGHSPAITEAKAEAHLSPNHVISDDRRAAGKRPRDTVPRDAHGDWRAHAGRADSISILLQQLQPGSRSWSRSSMGACPITLQVLG